MGSEGGGLAGPTPLSELQRRLASGAETPTSVARECLRRANGNASRNTYVSLDEAALLERAADLERRYAGEASRPPLYGVPVSLKDCFDLAGTVTTAGTRFYAERSGVAVQDSAMAQRLRAAGMLIVGKTHMHGLAYGITGENPDFGDCVQPRDRTLLTGGSSSGAAASVQEGSALVGIGTDTGGSVRVPAALCGLVGYRASHALAREAGAAGLWAGGMHLSETFDTVGVFVRDLRDAAPVADGLFGVGVAKVPEGVRVGCVVGEFLDDCEPEIIDSLRRWREGMVRAGAEVADVDAAWWQGAQEVFTGIQASEAAELHRGHYDAFEPLVAQRLAWGAALGKAEVNVLRERMAEFTERLLGMFADFDFLMLPAAPARRLIAGQDQSGARGRILKYTTPFSLAGLPALSLPGEMVGGALGSGVQIGAPPGHDPRLLTWGWQLGERIAGSDVNRALWRG